MKKTKHYFRLKGKNAEKIIHNLAKKTFLVDWCFTNPMLDSNKELCDLLVVFDKIVIIFQIKDLKLNDDGFYKKSEVDKNLRQLSGAKRQMFKVKSKIRLLNSRRNEEVFDPNLIEEVFLVSVLLGKGESHYSALEKIKNHYVHVFTKKFTEIVMNELDTISDFCDYLREKESFFIEKEKSIVVSGGEEEILAIYLKEGKSFGQYKNADNIYLDGTLWKNLIKEPKFLKKKRADEISYGWDSIINRVHTTGSSEYEAVARELARSNRFERRYLSKVFMEAHTRAHKDNEADLFRRIMFTDGITYCFLFADDFDNQRTKRQTMLASICYLARGKYPENQKVIGIATEKIFREQCSYDFVLLDKPIWSDEDQKKVELLQKETGMFVNPIIGETHEDEYPE